MKKRITVAGLLFAFVCLHANAFAATSSTRCSLWASIIPSRAVYEENGARVSLIFTLLNDGKTDVVARMNNSKLFVNGKAVDWEWENEEHIHDWLKKGEVIKPGAVRNTQTQYATRLYRNFRKPGLYKLQWSGENFCSPEISIRVRARQNGDSEYSTLKLMRQIRAVLPAGWEVSYSELYDGFLEIARLQRTKISPRWMVNDNEINHEEEMRHLSFISFGLSVALSLLTPEEYRWQKEENAQIGKRMSAFDEKEGLPRNAKGQISTAFSDHTKDKQVAHYQWLHRLQKNLPDFYCDDISLFERSSSSALEELEDAKVRREYENVQAAVFKLLKRYEAEAPQK